MERAKMEQPENKNGGENEQLSKLAAQQEALRRELQKMAGQMDKDGKSGNAELKRIADNMEKAETDLVNKRISQETLNRQEENINPTTGS